MNTRRILSYRIIFVVVEQSKSIIMKLHRAHIYIHSHYIKNYFENFKFSIFTKNILFKKE
jgi:hypothetical protein